MGSRYVPEPVNDPETIQGCVITDVTTIANTAVASTFNPFRMKNHEISEETSSDLAGAIEINSSSESLDPAEEVNSEQLIIEAADVPNTADGTLLKGVQLPYFLAIPNDALFLFLFL